MSEAPPDRRLSLLSGIGSILGPVGAVLYETGHLRVSPGDPIHDIWLLVAVAGVGAGVGAVAFFRGAKISGLVCFLSNAVVFGLYGFIAAFFASGGSR